MCLLLVDIAGKDIAPKEQDALMGSWIRGGLLAPGKLPLAAGLVSIGLVVVGCKMVRLGYELLSGPEYANFNEVVDNRLSADSGLLEHYLMIGMTEPSARDAQTDVSLVFELYRADSCDSAPGRSMPAVGR